MLQMTSCDHMFKELCEFMVGSPSREVMTLTCLVTDGLLKVETKYSICHVALQNNMIEGSLNFVNRSSSLHFTTLRNLLAIGIVADVFVLARDISRLRD